MSENCSPEIGKCNHGGVDEGEFDFSAKTNELSRVKKVIGIVSGKGGVGKSLVTSMLAVEMSRNGYNTAILDADITGPSIPKAFGLKERAMANEQGLYPVKSQTGIDIMSINLLLENDTEPVVWRGPVIGNTVKQFWTDVIWGDVDYMFIDMPPGTGDVPLTVFQSIPVDGIIIVTSPQELVSMIVSKAVNMANMMNIPIIGLVENMSYFECTDCCKKHSIFGESHIDEIAGKYNLDVLAKLPIDPKIAASCDKGLIELFNRDWLEPVVGIIENFGESKMEESIMKIAVANANGSVSEHFGHCDGFDMFHIADNKIVKREFFESPEHQPGVLPNFLNDKGAKVVIAGGMGGGAVQIFNEKNIEVVVGASGDAHEAVERYLEGALKSTGSVCNHNHGDECGGH